MFLSETKEAMFWQNAKAKLVTSDVIYSSTFLDHSQIEEYGIESACVDRDIYMCNHESIRLVSGEVLRQ